MEIGINQTEENIFVDLVIRNGYVITMDAKGTRYRSADIAVVNGGIAALGPNLRVQGKKEIEARGNAVLPGLIDCHMHETLMRGLCEDLPLMRWLEEICFPKDRSERPEHIHAAALMNQLEMIRGGITTFIDIFRFPHEAALIAEQSGLRAIFSPQVIDEPAGAGETLESSLDFIREWKDRVPGRIFTWFGPHAPYSCTPKTFQAMRDLAEQYDIGIHTHLAETKDEVDLFQNRFGKTPVEYLNDLGLLSPRLLAAHAIHLTENDIQLLAEHDVAASYNPSSNMKLADGVAKVPEMLAAGIRVGLGTDSNLSNNNLDMFEEMRIGATLQKLWRMDAEALPCELILRMATNLAARCLGMDRQIGSLEPGKRADIILVNLHAPHMWPILPEPRSNVIEQLVYSAGAADVLTTIVDGKILMQDRNVLTIDEAPVEQIVNQASQDLMRAAGLEERLELIAERRNSR
jgi:5-methylthioadenosine/S-adenosylhomocysteine deaminase